MAIIYDHFDDEHGVLKPEKCPDFVKEAELVRPKTPLGFADPVDEHYPINTPSNVYMSMEYFTKVASQLDDQYAQLVANKLNDAAETFGLPYRVEFEPEGPTMEKNAQELKEELIKFEYNYAKIPWQERRERAQLLTKYASVYGIEVGDLSPLVAQYASDSIGDAFDKAITMRELLASQDPKLKEDIEAIKSYKDKINVDHLIQALALLDKQHNLDIFYDTGLPDPVLSITGGAPVVETVDKIPDEIIESLKDAIEPDTLNQPLDKLPEELKKMLKEKYGLQDK